MEHKFNAQSDLKMLHMHISSFFFECKDIIGIYNFMQFPASDSLGH
jgi:hypothetical protein